MANSELLLDILNDQVTPALGCTEPVAVALAVAKAKEILDNSFERVDIKVDRNIFKNALAVGIPGTDKKGLHMAVALALIAGNSEYNLEVLKDITEEDVKKAQEIIDKGIINIIIVDSNELYIEAIVENACENCRVIIKSKHDNIVQIKKNDKIIFSKEKEVENAVSIRDNIKEMKIKDLKEFVDRVDLEQLALVFSAIEMNKNIANKASMSNEFSKALRQGIDAQNMDIKHYAKYLTSAAAYARMTGYPLPVMSCAGSGNHGLTAVLPVVAVGEKKQIDKDKLIRGVTLSLLLTIYVKSYTGTLTPVCGCGVAAGIGASAGIVYILDGSLNQIEASIKNMVGSVSGMICDGGKPGCAFKLAVSSDAAIESAMMALNNIVISSYDGIVDETAEKTIMNLGKVSTQGMSNTDETILEIMLAKFK